jgi:hypothetical protein
MYSLPPFVTWSFALGLINLRTVVLLDAFRCTFLRSRLSSLQHSTSGVEDQNSVKDQQAAKLAQTTAGGKSLPQHDWMHHFSLPRFLSPTSTGQSSATGADTSNQSGQQMLAESFRRGSYSAHEDIPSYQVGSLAFSLEHFVCVFASDSLYVLHPLLCQSAQSPPV